MGWLADRLWCSASKNRLQASFLILSRSLFFTKVLMHEWPEKTEGKHQKCFWSVGVLSDHKLNVSTWILIGIQASSEGDEQPLWDCACIQIRSRSIEMADKCKECATHLQTKWDHTLSLLAPTELYNKGEGAGWTAVCICTLHVWHFNPQTKTTVANWRIPRFILFTYHPHRHYVIHGLFHRSITQDHMHLQQQRQCESE